jgi:2-hydroxychromene-2-carboxylate isomerase
MAGVDAGSDVGDLAEALHQGVWSDELDMADEANLIAVANKAGYDGEALFASAQSGNLDARYDALTQEAIAANVFGAPTYVVDGENFWGQDRLDFLQEKLA